MFAQIVNKLINSFRLFSLVHLKLNKESECEVMPGGGYMSVNFLLRLLTMNILNIILKLSLPKPGVCFSVFSIELGSRVSGIAKVGYKISLKRHCLGYTPIILVNVRQCP